jgi:hypothetical protein
MEKAPDPASPSTKRNDPCPCGSGKRFKHCCGNAASVYSIDVSALLDEAAQHLTTNPTHTEALCQKALKHQPRNVDAMQLMAAAMVQTGRAEPAIQIFSRAVEIQPANDAVRFNMGLALKKSNKLDEALQCFQYAMRLRPSNAPARMEGVNALGELIKMGALTFSDPTNKKRYSPPKSGAHMISVVICSIDDRKFLAVTENYRRLLQGWQYEIIGIHDAKSLCDGYNRGVLQARGDVVVFSHDDIEILSPDFADVIMSSLCTHAMIGVAGATCFPANGKWMAPGWPYTHGQIAHCLSDWKRYWVDVFGVGMPCSPGIQVVDGVFFAVRRDVIDSLRFDDALFDGFHFYDLDFSYRVFRAGFSIAVSNEIVIAHHSGGNLDAVWSSYANRFIDKHAGNISTPTITPTYWSHGGASRVRRIVR